ncbi:EamA family transporter [Phormidesmis priestleyi ULC007]|uniref:EamA family transporter n=1 Tax=Phormidesmis priestleyi ULC007 TaxID=1920490 RepID=A0A2T1D895_9CYAN|nr:DMT family transporter [Phormidesmis priestleyi]PSB16718.1 EamA family transporter [Phormidesmis priestleyi ULC007]PZO47581.1 MAG: EamA family transporter [Phormidesmis priestleyi]
MHLKITESRSPFIPVLLIAPFFLWGTAMVAMKGVIPHTTPFFMAGVRLVPAGVLVVVAGALMGRPQPKGWAAWLWIALFGLIDGTLFQGFLAQGLMRTGAGLGSVMIDSQPLAVALLALWLFGETIGLWGWLGLGIGVLGISLLGLPEAWIGSAGDWLMTAIAHGQWTISSDRSISDLFLSLFDNGQWLMLLAALSMAVGTVMVRYVCRHADPVTATGWHMILGGLPLFALSNQLESAQWVDLTTANWMALAYSTIFGSAIAYGLFFYFASSGSLTSLSSLTFLTPVFALLFGNLFLSEVLSQVQWFGVCLTLVSIYLINQREVLSQRFKRLTFYGVSPDQEDEIQNRSVILQSPLEISEITIGSLPIVESESE